MLYRCTDGICEIEQGMSKPWPKPCEPHNAPFKYVKELRTTTGLRASAPRKKPRPALKKGKGFAASPEQQKKVRDLPCIVCTRDRHEAAIEAAHVYPRRMCPCECVEGVVPLCADHHRSYDAGELDLLPYLDRGYRAEAVHAFVEHEIPLSFVLEKVSPRPSEHSREVG